MIDYEDEDEYDRRDEPVPNESTVLARVIAAQPVNPADPPRKLSDEDRQRLADEIEMDML